MSDERTFTGDTITNAIWGMVRYQLDHPAPDAVLNIESHLYNVTVQANNCAYDLDVGKHLWLNGGRWSRLIKEYVAREALDRFIAQAGEIMRGEARKGATANMMFRDPDRYAKKHRWGGCLMGLTFRGDPADNPTITFYSRTTYMGYMGLLDAAIAHVLARQIGDSSKIAFRWHITSSQLHCFKTLPYIYSQPDLIVRLERYERIIRAGRVKRASIPPTWWHMAKWYGKVLDAFAEHGVGMLEQEKYGPFRRIKRRWLEFKGHLKKHVPPSLSCSDLDFSKAV